MKKSKEIVKKTKKFCIETTFAYPLIVKSGYGCYIEDINGKLYLDFNSNVCSCAVGYNHPEIVNVIRKFVGVGAHKIAGQDFYSEEQAELAEQLIKITPKNLNRVLLVNTGAEAVENAMKFAFRKKGPLPGVSCWGAFHGRTLGALTFTDSKAVQKKNYPEINHETIKFCTRDNDPHINGLEELIEREWIPAFMIVECVQGEGGYNVASKKFIKNLRKTSKKYDFPLIIDEVQSGLGRTGKWWSFEHYGIKPDIITSAKALQVGATISSKKYDPKESGSVSSTWGGGCVPTGSLVIGEKTKPIEKIKVGDKVFTHKGRLQKVTKIFKRHYNGFLIKITPYFGDPLYFTPEHPLFLKELPIKKGKPRKIVWKRADEIQVYRKSERIHSDLLSLVELKGKINEYLGIIKGRIKGKKYKKKILLTPNLGRLIGYYLAEGSVSIDDKKNRGVIEFSFSKHEKELKNDVRKITKKELKRECWVKDRGSWITVAFGYKPLASLFKRLFGHKADEKHLPINILLSSNKEFLKELIKGYWHGDGWLEREAGFPCTTVSKTLAYQLRFILLKLGIFASVYRIKRKKSLGRGYSYRLRIISKFWEDFEKLLSGRGIPAKKSSRQVKMSKNNNRKVFWIGIKKIEKIPFEGVVHNLEVEKDKSYNVLGYGVHNCRIDLAIGLKTIEIIKHEKLIDNAKKMGNYMMKRLREMKRKYSKIVDVRGLGLMIGAEFSKEIYKDIIPKIAFKKGLLLLGCGKKTIRITPPLIISREEVDKGLNIFEDIIKHLKH